MTYERIEREIMLYITYERIEREIRRLREDPRPNEWKNGLGPAAMEVWHKTCLEAAESLRLLLDENKRLREALRKIAKEHDADGSMRYEARAALDKHCEGDTSG